jgi:Zn-dependent protease with chaperone function
MIYARLLRQLWLPYAQRSADRLALLLIRNPQLMMSAILKEYAATDAGMQELGVTSEDVTNWISQKGHIGMKGEEISTQYKLGRAIHEAPILEERIQELQRWNNSPDFKNAVEKLASVKR